MGSAETFSNHTGNRRFVVPCERFYSNTISMRRPLYHDNIEKTRCEIATKNAISLRVQSIFRSFATSSCDMESIDQVKERAQAHPETMTEEDWTFVLTPTEYEVTRKRGTEAPFSCQEVYEEHRLGRYNCV